MLGKTRRQRASSKTDLGKPLPPSRVACNAVTDFANKHFVPLPPFPQPSSWLERARCNPARLKSAARSVKKPRRPVLVLMFFSPSAQEKCQSIGSCSILG